MDTIIDILYNVLPIIIKRLKCPNCRDFADRYKFSNLLNGIKNAITGLKWTQNLGVLQ